MLPVSSRLGSYEILAPLGAGGMGEVYRAKDTKLGREVALKILPATFTNDPERLARFRREAQVLASLNHPHIGAIYGLEEANGTQFLVLELVDGESLDKRIARGKLPVDEALAIAKQIAEALEAAHEKGIIHRDLKPANIALTTDGNVKVLDFGLAKATENAAGTSLDVTNSPTITSPARMTSVGMILGTAAYMSPEQAKGRPADKRSDVWAFGCVVFEMLTGKSAFGAESMTEVLANVLRAEPDWRLVPGAIPGAVRHVVERCLRKDPARRFQHIGDARVELSEPFESLPTAANAPSRRRSRRMLTAWLASVAAAAILGGLAARFFGPRQPRPELRLDVATPPTTEPLSFALSPDGKQLAYVGTSGSASGLWIRTLDAGTTRHLAGTEDARQPFWSPDSQSLAFFATGRLARIDLENGAVRTLTNSINAFGGTWNRDGVVLFSGRAAGALLRMSADGGQVEDATHLGPQQLSHRSPQFLPDGQHFLYYATGGADARGIYVAELRHPQGRRVLDGESAGAYSNGFLLFARQGTLFAQRFDLTTLTVTGAAKPVANDVGAPGSFGVCSTSDAGLIAYRAGASRGRRQLQWVDRTGSVLRTLGEPMGIASLALAPDGKRVALSRFDGGNPDIWVVDTDVARQVRLTSWPGIDIAPVWSPDATRIAFQSHQTEPGALYEVATSGGSEPTLLLSGPRGLFPTDWAPDGRAVLFQTFDATTRWDIWMLPLDGARTAIPVLQTAFDERDARFSPDGHWIAYSSDESGREEIYVRKVHGPTVKVPISTTGGVQPAWRHDRNELFYLALDGRLMSVPLEISEDAIVGAAPTPLFMTHIGSMVGSLTRQNYAVTADGNRFLMNTMADDPNQAPITVVVNWSGTR